MKMTEIYGLTNLNKCFIAGSSKNIRVDRSSQTDLLVASDKVYCSLMDYFKLKPCFSFYYVLIIFRLFLLCLLSCSCSCFFFLFFSFFPPDNPSVRFEKNLIFQFVGLRQIVTCHVMGTPKPTVTWLRNGIKLGDGDLNGTVRIRNNVVSGAFGDQIHELLLDTAQLEHSGNYTCEARNKYHARQRNIVVTVICKSNYIVSYIFFLSAFVTCCVIHLPKLSPPTTHPHPSLFLAKREVYFHILRHEI